MRLLPIGVVVFLAGAPLLHAQSRATAIADAPIFVLPDSSRDPIRVARVGTQFNVLGQEGDWIHIEFQDPQYGRRVGYVQMKLLKLTDRALEPLDLSMPAAATPRPDPQLARPTQPPPPRQVAVPSPSSSSTVGGYLSGNFSYQTPETKEFTQAGAAPFRREAAGFGSAFTIQSAPSVDIGGGVLFSIGEMSRVGFGAAFTRFRDEHEAGVAIILPHPIFFNQDAEDTAITDRPLERTERGLHLQGVYVADIPRATFTVFGGPSFMTLRQELVADVDIIETVGLFSHTVDITDTTIEEGRTSAWGFNAGVDVGVFFSRNVGVGAIVRYTRATVELRNAIQNTLDGDEDVTEEQRIGGIQFGAGVRLRF